MGISLQLASPTSWRVSWTNHILMVVAIMLMPSDNNDVLNGNTGGMEMMAHGAEYGVDVSFPSHHRNVSTNYAWLPHNLHPDAFPTPKEYIDMPVQPLGNREQVYLDMMQGCVDKYGSKGWRCWEYEHDRVDMSLRQPQSMVNYTENGFKKIKAPPEVWTLIESFWNRNSEYWKEEIWPPGNTYTNHWHSKTYMVSVEDQNLRGGGNQLKQAIWDAARTTIQGWTGQELTQCSLYGIRVYTTGAMLNTHVDRLPLVSSAIINVAQDVDEPWPLEVIGHDGRAYNVTMEPGDMVLYESHSVLHGRPFPLKGRYMANLFVHFEPTGHTSKYHGQDSSFEVNVDEQYRKALQSGTGGHEAAESIERRKTYHIPSYVLPNSPEEEHIIENNVPEQPQSFTTGSTQAHQLAQQGYHVELSQLLDHEEHLVDALDKNGWTPLHEASRGGHAEVIKLLVDKGADINRRSLHGSGGTPLYYAEWAHGKDSMAYQILESLGGVSIGPEL